MRRALFFLPRPFPLRRMGWSQKKTITVTGVIISSADKEPVIAASVSCVEFPTTGTLTDVNGRFTLNYQMQLRTLRSAVSDSTSSSCPSPRVR